MTSAFSTLGLALGSLVTSALVQYAPAPTRLIWWALLAVFAVSIIAVLAMAEPGSRRPGVLASLRPRVAVPRQARGAFAGPFRVSRDMGTRRPVPLAGAVAGRPGDRLAEPAVGRAGDLPALRYRGRGGVCAAHVSSRAAMLAGCLFLLAGMAVTFGAIATTTSAVFFRRRGRGRRLRPGLPGIVPHDHRPGRARPARRPGGRHLPRGLPRVQRPGADRRGHDDEVRAALHCPGLLRGARRPGRGRGRHLLLAPGRASQPAAPPGRSETSGTSTTPPFGQAGHPADAVPATAEQAS